MNYSPGNLSRMQHDQWGKGAPRTWDILVLFPALPLDKSLPPCASVSPTIKWS